MDGAQAYYLYKNEEGSVFGPLPFEQLKSWALEARISPLDSVSVDKASWMKAPMLSELQMDWLVQVGPEEFYGPTTLGAIREFLKEGEIGEDTPLINCCEGRQTTLREIPTPAPVEGGDVEEPRKAARPRAGSLKVGLQQRLRELEDALLRERRYSASLEERYRKLEARYRAAVGAAGDGRGEALRGEIV